MGMDISPQERDRITRQANAVETRKQIIGEVIQLCRIWCVAGLFVIAALGTVALYLLSVSS